MKIKLMLETVWNQVQCHWTSKSLTEVDQLTEKEKIKDDHSCYIVL